MIDHIVNSKIKTLIKTIKKAKTAKKILIKNLIVFQNMRKININKTNNIPRKFISKIIIKKISVFFETDMEIFFIKKVLQMLISIKVMMI